MRHERRTARRANTQESLVQTGLGAPVSRTRGIRANHGSPTTPGTPPQGSRYLHHQSQTQNSGKLASLNSSNAVPSNLTPVTAASRRTARVPHASEDSLMHNRLSMESTTSTVTNSTITGDVGRLDESGPHLWTDDQVAVIVRTLEEGKAPTKDQIKHGLRAPHQPNPDPSSAFKFLPTWNPDAPPPPTTPYVLPHVPPGLVDRWARELKKRSDWPHDTRAIRSKLRRMAEEVASEQGLHVSPRKSILNPSNSLSGASNDGDIEEEEEQGEDGVMAMEYEQSHEEEDDIIISPVTDVRLPNGQRNDARVLQSSLAFQRNEDNINYDPWRPVHSASYSRSRSPIKAHSPSPTHSFSREATISPTNSNFSFNSANDISPTKSTQGISPEKTSSIGRYLSPLLPAATLSRPNRSRSISPSRGSGRGSPSPAKGKGKDKLPPTSLQTPSLSPMQLSPAKDQAISVFQSRSIQRIKGTPHTVVDPMDLMASIDGGRRDELDELTGAKFRPGKSAGRAPIPMPFFSRDMVRSKEESERREQKGQVSAVPTDLFSFSSTTGERESEQTNAAPMATGNGSGATAYSSISSLFSNGSMRKVINGLGGSKGNAPDAPSTGRTSRNNSTSSTPANQPQLPIMRRDDPNPVVTANKLAPIPALPSLTQTHPHLADHFANGRGGIKRSASFSKPAELIKRAPSYGGPAKPKTQQQPPALGDPPKVESTAQDSHRPRHKRERSDSSVEVESEYDTEDVPPSSAPSSDRIVQVSPLKSAVSWDSSSPSPEKLDTIYGSAKRMLASPGKLLAGPNLLPGKLFGRRKAKSKTGAVETVERTGSVGASPVGDDTLSPVSRPDDDAMDIDVDHLQTSAQHHSGHSSGGTDNMAISPTDPASPLGGVTPRPKVMSTPKPLLTRKISADWDIFGGRHTSAELRSVRHSPIEERREGEPRRKRVKTDELESPPSQLRGGLLGYDPSVPRVLSPRAMSDGPARRFYKRSSTPKTPPRRAATPRSPRLLPGGGRTTSARSPKSPMRLRVRSRDNTPQPFISQAANSSATSTPDVDAGGTRTSSLIIPKGDSTRSATHTTTAATISSASKARRSIQETATKPTTTTSSGKASSSKNVPKREPSFFGAPLPNPQQSRGTTRFPTASTASISSVLFPGGVPDKGDGQAFPGLGSGEEGIIRAGESAASARKADAVGKARAALRSGLGGHGRSRMTRSISMLGPGDISRPY